MSHDGPDQPEATRPTDIQRRKDEHIALAATDGVAFRDRTHLLEQVQLIHQALPELSVDEIDLSVELFGKRLRAPIVIASMTGGTPRAAQINRDLAAIAEARGYGLGLGSQRAMQREPELSATFQIREEAPSALVIGNLGVVQAREIHTPHLGAKRATKLADSHGLPVVRQVTEERLLHPSR